MARARIRLTVAIAPVLVLLTAPGGAAAVGTGPTVTTGAASNIYATTAVLNGSVQSTLPLTSCQFKYGPEPSLMLGAQTKKCQFVQNSDGVYVVLTGLTPETRYYYQLSASDASGTTSGKTLSFMTTATPPPAPKATTGQASNVTATSATLGGTVNAEDVAVTGCKFEYGTTTSYGQTAQCSPPPQSTKSDQAETADISNLTDGTEYHFRIVFSTEGGTATGSDQTFVATAGTSSSPTGTATTGQPRDVSATSATLTGTVNAQGQSGDSCFFYYGAGASGTYQASVPCSTESVSGSSDQSEAAGVTGLTPDVEYHYVIALSTASGSVVGSPVTFKTLRGASATTLKATRVTGTSAFLNGTVNASGAHVTACFFQFARANFSSTGAAPRSAGRLACKPSPSGSGSVAVSARITRLASAATYHFRVVLQTQGGGATGAVLSFRTRNAKVPGVRITKSRLSRSNRTASFSFRGTRYRATRYECALARMRKGRVGRLHYARCRSPKAYRRLRRGATYEFLVRAGNRSGYGRPARKRFKV